MRCEACMDTGIVMSHDEDNGKVCQFCNLNKAKNVKEDLISNLSTMIRCDSCKDLSDKIIMLFEQLEIIEDENLQMKEIIRKQEEYIEDKTDSLRILNNELKTIVIEQATKIKNMQRYFDQQGFE